MTNQSASPPSVPALDASPMSPYYVGKVPSAGWFAIETPAEIDLEHDPRTGKKTSEKNRCSYWLDADVFDTLIENFDPTINGGNGLPINNSHLRPEHDKVGGEALGFVRAIARRDNLLYAYLDLTDDGHEALDEGEFWAASTEYLLSDMIERETRDGVTWFTPTRLDCMALTNTPRQSAQPGLVTRNNQTQLRTNTMPKPKTARSRNSNPPVTEKADNTSTPEDVTDNMPPAPEVAENMEETSEDELYRVLDVIAKIAGLPENDEITADQIIEAVQRLADERDAALNMTEPIQPAMNRRRIVLHAKNANAPLRTSATPSSMPSSRNTPRATQRAKNAVAALAAQQGGKLTPAQHRAAFNAALTPTE